jgi:glycosyltransferase involved in cell wall biosynthesis
LPHCQVLQEISKSQYLMMTSVTEGLPNVIIEAFSVGTPVISTNVGGVSEIVTDKVNGFLIGFNPEKNIEIISNILDLSQGKYLEIRCNAIKRAEKFTVEKSIEKLNEIIY